MSSEDSGYRKQAIAWGVVAAVSFIFLAVFSANIAYFRQILNAEPSAPVTFAPAESMLWISVILMLVALALFITSACFTAFAAIPAQRKRLPLQFDPTKCVSTNPGFVSPFAAVGKPGPAPQVPQARQYYRAPQQQQYPSSQYPS